MISYEYLAGLIDGEGYLSIKHRNKRQDYEIVPGISNTHLGVLEVVREQFGGYITKSKMYSTNKKQGYHWIEKNPVRVRNLIDRVIVFSIIKKERMELALAYLDFIFAARATYLHQRQSNGHMAKKPLWVYQGEKVFRDKMVALNARHNTAEELQQPLNATEGNANQGLLSLVGGQ